jgi:hypothetical protein
MATKIRTHFKGPLSEGGNLIPMTVDPTLTPSAKNGLTGSQTVAVSDLNGIITNTGNTGVLTLLLPSAATAGVENSALKLQITVASNVVVAPASGEKIFLGGSGTANATMTVAGTVGNYADLYSDGTQWMVVGYSGVLTKSS